MPTGFDVKDNVAIYFCLSANRMGGAGAQALKDQIALLEAWDARQPKNPIYLWLYNTFPLEIADRGRFYCYPGFFAKEAGRQLAHFHKLGVLGIFHCGFNGEVENYVSYQMMDDPTLDVDKLLDRYFAAYGAAARPLRAWYDLAESRYMDPSLIPPGPGGKPYNGSQTVVIAWEHLGDAKAMRKLGALMNKALTKATGEAAKRLDLWDKGVCGYMRTGRETYLKRMEAPIPSVTAARVPAAGGDPDKVEWKQAGDLGDKWYLRGGKNSSKREFHGKVCHDGEYFYMELIEENVTADQLNVSPTTVRLSFSEVAVSSSTSIGCMIK